MTIEDLKRAHAKLKTSDPTIGFPGREDKILELETFLIERLKVRKSEQEKRQRVEAGLVANIQRHSNKTIFLCGVPGTGKTAVALSVVAKLEKKIQDKKNNGLHKFKCVYVNGQHVPEPSKVYCQILYDLKKLKYGPERAQNELDKIFLPALQSTNKRSRTKADENMFYIVIVDELDVLYGEKRQTVFYNLFDWPTSNESRLILITIANAMDLPERFMRGRIGSRLGWEKLVFEPYSSVHLETILQARLGQTLLNKCFDRTAILVASRRIGRSTGDARRVLDTCNLALEEAIRSGQSKVTSAIVDRVGFQNVDKIRVRLVNSLPPLFVLTLKGIIKESESQGEDNIHGKGVYTQVVHLLKQQSQHPWLLEHILAYDEFNYILNHLSSLHLICLEVDGPLMAKRMYIKDTSDSFRDVIRNLAVITE